MHIGDIGFRDVRVEITRIMANQMEQKRKVKWKLGLDGFGFHREFVM